MKVNSESEVAQSCPTLLDPMDCSLQGSSVHGIFQARVLEPIIQSEVSQKEKHQYSILTHISEKAIAPHSSSLGWKIPWMEEPGRLQSMGSLGVRDG